MESVQSKRFRHFAGALSLVALGVACLAGIMGFPVLVGDGLLAFVAIPWLAFIGHLHLTNVLSSEEKAVWRRELWWGHRSIIAIWAYLLASDLHERTKGFRPYRAEP
jgi:hypothetical protein